MTERETLLAALQALERELGRAPEIADVLEADDVPSLATVQDEFGSWYRALWAADITPTEPPSYWTNADIEAGLRALGDGPDAPPVTGDLTRSPIYPSLSVIHNRFESWEAALDAAGYDVRRVPMLDDIEAVNDSHDALAAAEFALTHAEWFADHGEGYAPETAELIERGQAVGVDELSAARAARLDLRERIEERAREAGVDLLLSPAAPGPAPEGIDDTGDPIMNLPWTNAGVPALTVPCGRVGDLPLGLQVVAPFGDDEALLAWGERIAAAVGDVGSVEA